MTVSDLSRRFAGVLFLLFSHMWHIAAQTTSAAQEPSVAATTNYSPYPTSSGSAGGPYAGDTTFVNSSPTDAAGENAAGASGSQGGSVNLSMGAIVAIVVVVAVVVLLGAATTVLFFVAKKRQWKVRQSIRRTANRVTSMVRPKTPRTPRAKPMTFPSVSEVSSTERTSSPPHKDTKASLKIDTSPRGIPRSTTPSINALPPALAAKKHQKTKSQQTRSRSAERRIDLEKRPRPITTSAFDMDSPVKGSIWTKMFGKK